MANLQNDAKTAIEYWGKAFDAIPKSAFALIAWHLANAFSGQADTAGAAEQAFVTEALALKHAGILSERHFLLISRNVKDN